MLGKLLGIGDVTSPIKALGSVFDQIFTSDEERIKAQAILRKVEQYPAILQAEINKVEAAHRSVFVAGWRPFIGWVCGLGLGYVWVLRPIINDLANWFGVTLGFLQIETDNMIQLVIALLGLGGLRTYEKLKGKSK